MKITKEQIDQLYQFTRQHFVEFYDLQSELVDHLANAIEEKWQENPKITFEEALEIEFKKFGVFGFMDVVEKRQTALGKRYNKIVWHHFKAFFTVPKIILTLFLFLLFFNLIKHLYQFQIVPILFGLLLLLSIPALYKNNRKRKQRNLKTGKIWLLEDIISGYGTFSGIIMLPIQFTNIFITHSKSAPNDSIIFLITLLTVSTYLVSYIMIKTIPSKSESYLKETYPEYELVNSSN